jgi:hypothetical protein
MPVRKAQYGDASTRPVRIYHSSCMNGSTTSRELRRHHDTATMSTIYNARMQAGLTPGTVPKVLEVPSTFSLN